MAEQWTEKAAKHAAKHTEYFEPDVMDSSAGHELKVKGLIAHNGRKITSVQFWDGAFSSAHFGRHVARIDAQGNETLFVRPDGSVLVDNYPHPKSGPERYVPAPAELTKHHAQLIKILHEALQEHAPK